jgi:hypothetical protein
MALTSVVVVGVLILLGLKAAGVLDSAPPSLASAAPNPVITSSTGAADPPDPPPIEIALPAPTPPIEPDAAIVVEHPPRLDPPSAPAGGTAESGTTTERRPGPPTEDTPKEPVATAPSGVTAGDGGVAEAEGAVQLRAVKFTMAEAEALTARCPGDKEASGSTSALVRDLLAGTCVVVATIDGTDYVGKVDVTEPTGLACRVSGGALSCR